MRGVPKALALAEGLANNHVLHCHATRRPVKSMDFLDPRGF